jgi:hypothetical protein
MTFPRMIFVCSALTAAMAACSGGASAQTDATKLAATLSGADKIAADKNPQCQLFTPADLSKLVGVPLEPGRDAGMGTACQWMAQSGQGYTMINVVPARFHEPHSGAPGFKTLTDVGTRGFVENDGGWRAGAIVGANSIVAEISGGGATEASAIALLKETIKRKAGK